jgi:crossover junction endodeoxyribonuclease RusA
MISLPWPPAKLSPNARTHWASKAKAARDYKMACFALMSKHRKELKGQNDFHLIFCPPDNRRRDLDNMLASSKHALDALSEITGVDDSNFTLTFKKGEPVKGGEILVIA